MAESKPVDSATGRWFFLCMFCGNFYSQFWWTSCPTIGRLGKQCINCPFHMLCKNIYCKIAWTHDYEKHRLHNICFASICMIVEVNVSIEFRSALHHFWSLFSIIYFRYGQLIPKEQASKSSDSHPRLIKPTILQGRILPKGIQVRCQSLAN